MLSKEIIIDRINGKYLFICCFFSLLFVYLIVGVIPVNKGAGWDGYAYLQLINSIAHSDWSLYDPYRIIRMSSFPQLILLRRLGFSQDTVIHFQVFWNITLLSLANVAIYKAALNASMNKERALMAAFLLLFTWPFMVMPVYYPVLSDHLALTFSCFSLWAWTRKSNFLLILLLFYGIWIIPSFILVPLIFLAFPFDSKIKLAYSFSGRWLSFLVLCMMVSVAIYVCYVINGNYLQDVSLHSLDIRSNKTSLKTGLNELKYFSLLACIVGISILTMVMLELIRNVSFWKGISIRYTAIGLIVSLASFLLMRYVVDFGTGFSGPPLLKFLMLQSLAAPFKPLVSHFLYFGPVILVSLFYIIRRMSNSLPLGVVVMFTAFMFPLFFGSESRQWVMILPVLILGTVLIPFGRVMSMILVIFTLLPLLPALRLKNSVLEAIKAKGGHQDEAWQAYFTYSGPWMNSDVYQSSLSLLILFVFAAWWASSLDRRLPQLK